MKLASEKCVPCSGDSSPLATAESEELLKKLPQWLIKTYDDEQHLIRRFEFENFKTALEFTIAVGDLAEAVNHHPSLITAWGNVTIHWWTHVIGGLHRNDFIMAARTEQLYNSLHNQD